MSAMSKYMRRCTSAARLFYSSNSASADIFNR
jgi:hypothetical protein